MKHPQPGCKMPSRETEMKIDDDIASLDLACIAYKACRDEGWPLEKVDRIEREYRAFLQLIRENRGRELLGPTRDIDLFWHHHILDTQKYIADCDQLFGAYIHHYPYSGIFGGEDLDKQKNRVARTYGVIKSLVE
jgi:hypothetical protein